MNKIILSSLIIAITVFLAGSAYFFFNGTQELNNQENIGLNDNENGFSSSSGNNLKPSTSETYLDLSGQGLKKLPDYVLSMKNLEFLDISNNLLEGALPAEIRQLSELRSLDASNNAMTGLPAELGQLKNLESLDVSDNQLTGLPYELGNLKKLQIFNLSNNNYSQQDLEIIRQNLPDTAIITDE